MHVYIGGLAKAKRVHGIVGFLVYSCGILSIVCGFYTKFWLSQFSDPVWFAVTAVTLLHLVILAAQILRIRL